MSSPGESPEQTPNLDPSGSGAAEELALAHGGWEKGLSQGYPFNPRLVTPGPCGSLPLPFPVGVEKPSHESQPLCSPSLSYFSSKPPKDPGKPLAPPIPHQLGPRPFSNLSYRDFLCGRLDD